MGERKMSIQDVHKQTGISRTTLTDIYYEKIKQMKFETIEKLCKAFNCKIGDLLELVD
jgi:DNA-binding Xre family transcriptional regulator